MPINWENNILGFVPKEDWLDIPFNVKRQGDPIDGLFGDLKTDNIAAKWQSLNAQYQIPVMAQFHAFDVETQTTVRTPVDTHSIEKGLIKVKINQSERMQALLKSGVRNEQMYDYVINDGINLAEQVITRTKVAKNELLATGKVTIKENNLDLTVDYGVAADQTGFVLDLSKGADVMGQIQGIIDAAKKKGITLTGLVTSQANLTKMRKNTALQTAIGGNIAAGGLVRVSALKDFLSEEFGLNEIIVNDLTYASERKDVNGAISQTIKRYYPENRMTFFARVNDGDLGVGLWGDPPTSQTTGEVSGSELSSFVTIKQWAEDDPDVLWTRAAALFMPLLFNPACLWIATVADNYLNSPTVEPEAQATTMWEVPVSSLQANDVAVGADAITGTIKYLGGSNAITNVWGPGNFLALKFTNLDSRATKVLVGLEPSVSSGLADLIPDPDKNGIFKISDKGEQKLVVISYNGDHATVKRYDLSGLTLQDAGA